MYKKAVFSIYSFSLLIFLAACSGKSESPTNASKNAENSAKGKDKPIVVSTVSAQIRPWHNTINSTGTVTALSSLDIKPQLSSSITAIAVKEGQFVNKGQLLFTLDTRSDDANTVKMQAALSKSQAQLQDAQRQLKRAQDLQNQGFVSQGALDTQLTAVASSQASVQSDAAALQAARVPLSYARILAPSAGRIGLIPVTVGSVVQANSTILTTLTQMQPIDVLFTIPQNHLQAALRALNTKTGRVRINAQATDNADELTTATQGQLIFVDSTVDSSTGTVKAKARFANLTHALWPGQFVRVQLQLEDNQNTLVIPTQAIVYGANQSATQASVYVANQGVAQKRNVTILGINGEQAAVGGDVKEHDAIIVYGRQNVRPDARVQLTATPPNDNATKNQPPQK